MQINNLEDKEYHDFLKNKLRSYNNTHSIYHKKSRQNGYIRYVNLKEELNNIFVAGAIARMYWNMMFLDIIYVEESKRKLGLGQKLLTQLINIAKENKCNYIALETYSFQAKNFYESFGFKIVGALKNYPPGETYYTMKLDLQNKI